MQTHTHSNTYTHTHTHTHTHTQTRSHGRMHAQTHTHTHARTLTHTHHRKEKETVFCNFVNFNCFGIQCDTVYWITSHSHAFFLNRSHIPPQSPASYQLLVSRVSFRCHSFTLSPASAYIHSIILQPCAIIQHVSQRCERPLR